MEPPDLRFLDTPEDEREAVFLIEMQMFAMRGYVSDLSAAVALFDQAGAAVGQGAPAPLMTSWKMLAAQQGIVTTYNYSMAAKSARGLLRKAKSLSALVQHVKLELAVEYFKGAFPKLRELRQTVLHQSEVMHTPERFNGNKNRITEGFGNNGLVGQSLFNNLYTASFAGEQLHFEMSNTKANVLATLCQDFFSAFPSGKQD